MASRLTEHEMFLAAQACEELAVNLRKHGFTEAAAKYEALDAKLYKMHLERRNILGQKGSHKHDPELARFGKKL